MVVDEIGEDRVRRPDRLAPQVGRLADDLVGVLAIGQPDDADVGQPDAAVGLDLADEVVQLGHAERAGGLAGRVDVVGERDLLRIARQERDLARGQRGPEARDDVVEAGLVGHQRVRIALDDHRLAGLADRALGLVDEVERAALVEERGRGTVEVLRTVVAGVAIGDEVAPAESDRIAVHVPDREDDPLPEPVVGAAPARPAGRRQPDGRELVRGRVALRHELLAGRLPATRRPAELVALDRLVAEATAAQVVKGGLARWMPGQDRVVEADRAVEDVAQPTLPGVVAAGPLVELDPRARGQDLERLGEADAVALHDEAEDVAAQATAEALPALASRRDIERRRLLTVERAESLVGAARLLQLDGLADHVDHAQLALDFRGDADGQIHLRVRARPLVPWRRRTCLSACQALDKPHRGEYYHVVKPLYTPGGY